MSSFLFFKIKFGPAHILKYIIAWLAQKKPYYLVITNYKSDRVKKLYLNTLCCAEHVSTFSIVIFELPITKIFENLRKHSKNDNVRFLANLPVIFYHFGNFGKGLGIVGVIFVDLCKGLGDVQSAWKTSKNIWICSEGFDYVGHLQNTSDLTGDNFVLIPSHVLNLQSGYMNQSVAIRIEYFFKCFLLATRIDYTIRL